MKNMDFGYAAAKRFVMAVITPMLKAIGLKLVHFVESRWQVKKQPTGK
jgi:hypothetical protein